VGVLLNENHANLGHSSYKVYPISLIICTAGEAHHIQKLAHMGISRFNEFNSHHFAPVVNLILGQSNHQEVANVAWAYAVVNVIDPLLSIQILLLHVKQGRLFFQESISFSSISGSCGKSGINLLPALREKCRHDLSRNPFSRQTSRRCYICALIHWHAS
jgi:hypothetical protein